MTTTVSMTAVELDPTLMSLRLHEEQACAGYLAARKAMKFAAAHAASMRQLSLEQPTRVDYRNAFNKASGDFLAASERTQLAYDRWIRAQLRTDAHWTETAGRTAGAA
jgi:hypothetical protein